MKGLQDHAFWLASFSVVACGENGGIRVRLTNTVCSNWRLATILLSLLREASEVHQTSSRSAQHNLMTQC